MRYRAVVEYDGTGYFGFQRQVEEPTIQSELEQSIDSVSGSQVSIDFAGRTDAGVHALGQVIAFDLDWRHSIPDLLRALNANLPESIALQQLAEAPSGFHPRFDARRRAYEYFIYNAPVRRPYWSRYSWHINRPLDVEAMNDAAGLIIGSHDFSSFGTPPQGTNTVREVFHSSWRIEDCLIIYRVEANAFLKRMVRSLVGSMKAVGDGAWTVEEFRKLFKAEGELQSRPTAPPTGLFLVEVTYDAEKLGE